MREMKESGVEWIGEIPKEWEVPKLKYIGQYINGYAFKPEDWSIKGKPIIRIQDLTGSANNPNYYCGEIDDKYLVKKGDILISWAATLDAFIWNKEDGWLNQHIFKAVPNTSLIDYSFFFWLIKIAMDNMNNGNKHGIVMQHVTLDVFDNFVVPVPPFETQHRIANYLDEKCAKIDSIIEKQREVIEKLKAYKLSVITEAVTKGLNPDVPMKDSGVEWIGEIPEHWLLMKSRFVIDKIGDIDHYMPDSVDIGFPYVMTGDLKEKVSDIEFDKCKQVSQKDYQDLSIKINPECGDVILARYATIGTVCYVDIKNEFLVSYSCVIMKSNSKLLFGKFLYYYLKSSTFLEEVKKYINSNTQGNLGIESLYQFIIVLPKYREQQQIVEYLDNKCSQIESTIMKKRAIIDKLTEYKKSLIYEVVTGKKEV